jgi:hypothetical protein
MFIILFLFSTLYGQGLIENPDFLAWETASVGDKAVYLSTIGENGTEVYSVNSYTLISKNQNEVNIEMAISRKVAGRWINVPATKIKHLKKVPRTEVFPKTFKNGGCGDEDVSVPAGNFNCHWTETFVKNGELETKKIVFKNKNVPGGVVKTITWYFKPLVSIHMSELVGM